MYWKAAIVKYEYYQVVGIILFNTLSQKERPRLYVLGRLEEKGLKNKWKRPMKIKRWLLYDHHSYSYASKFLKGTIFNDDFKLTEIGERNKLWPFDKDIIKKKFPAMTKEIFKEMNKKKK